MKAVLVKQPGGPEQLYVGEAPLPSLKSEEILVEVRATAVNRADTLQRKGNYPPPPGASTIIGLEAAGVVSKLGPNCKSSFKEGDRVMCLLAGGGYAQYVNVHEGCVMPIPDSFSFEHAAAIPETWLTAFQLLFTIGKINKDDVVLVHAGASGVGTAAIQLAKMVGAQVVVTCGSQAKVEYCEKLGAKAINYKSKPFASSVTTYVEEELKQKGVSLILDCVGASYATMNLEVAATDARWVLFGTMGGVSVEKFPLGSILQKRIQLTGTTLRSRSPSYKSDLVSHFSQVALPEFRKGGRLSVFVDKVFEMNQISEAHSHVDADQTMGKVVIKVPSAL